MYHEIFMSSFPAPKEGEGIDRWTQDGGAAAKVAIEGGIAEVVRMLVWDLEQGGPQGADYLVKGESPKMFPQFGFRPWFRVSEQDGRVWYRAEMGELGSVGATYPGLSIPGVQAKAPHAVPPFDVAPPTGDARGGLTFEFGSTEYMRQGGAIETVKYSEVPGDVLFRGYVIDKGVLTMTGKLGMGQGSTFGGLGPRFDLQLNGKPVDASKLDSVTVRVSASTKMLRLSLVGSDRATRKNRCYPVYMLEVDDQMKEYTVPFSKFAPEPSCGTKARELRDTLPELTAIEVVSTRITRLPLTISVGATTLNP